MSSKTGKKQPQKAAGGAKGRDTQTAWQDHALHLGAAIIVDLHKQCPDQFTALECSYDALIGKKGLHYVIADGTVKQLQPDSDSADQKLDRISASAVEKLFQRKRGILEALVAERVRNWDDPTSRP